MKKSGNIKVLIGPSSFAEADKDPLEKLIAAGIEVIGNPYRRKYTKQELLSLLTGVTGVIAGLEPYDGEVIRASSLKVISRAGSGMSSVDIDAAKEMGVAVFNTPLAPVDAVAELTIGCLLSLLRQIHQMSLSLHEKRWERKIGEQISGKTVAVIGYGNIGRRVSQLLQAFGSQVVAIDPGLSQNACDVPLVDLDSALPTADVITIHANVEKVILGHSQFSRIKHGAYIMNASRGSVIDEEALLAAISNKTVAGAWIDTFGQEPYNGPLCDCEQVILTPHIGSYTKECRSKMEMEAVENLLTGLGR